MCRQILVNLVDINLRVPRCRAWVYLGILATSLTHKTGNVRINVTLRRVRVTILAMEKQYVLLILSV
jgi:hypothetical protein